MIFSKNQAVVVILILLIHLNLQASNSYYIYGNKSPTFNLWGETGLIVLPSALLPEAGNIHFTFSNNDFMKYGALTVSPFSWMQASYFYYRPRDLWWTGPGTEGQFLDKGFSVKFGKRFSDSLSAAIGLYDFAGTGFFDREYLIASYEKDFFRLTGGLGFGKLSYQKGFSNPLGILFPQFKNRPTVSSNIGRGGQPSYDKWFRGNANFIFGAEFFLSGNFKNLSVKVDYDPFDYIRSFSSRINRGGADLDLRKKDSNLNYGISYAFGESVSLGVSYIKGNTLALNFSFGGNFSKPFFPKKTEKVEILDSNKGESRRFEFYEDLIANTNRRNIFLQTAELKDEELTVAVSSSQYRDPIMIHALVGETARKASLLNKTNLNKVSTINVNVGHELHKITTPIKYFEDREHQFLEVVDLNTNYQPGNGDSYKNLEFRPIIKYPASFTGITPALVNHIGSPQQFYFGGLVLRIDNELQLSSKLQINTQFNYDLGNNFSEKTSFPDSRLPNVRTDIVSYLQQSDTYITRMQLDYFFSPKKELFGKFSAGILEDMYAGAGIEFLYKPFNKNFSIGLEMFKAQKREFDRKFGLLDYKINTGHINFNYHIPQLGILGTFSYGRYLAGDQGYTFDISRRLSSGFRTGIFFTRTNVSPRLFGEGSFDKGFYFQIPIELFLTGYRGGYLNFKLRPLTRDGGQKLEPGNDLIGIMHNTSKSELRRDLRSFND